MVRSGIVIVFISCRRWIPQCSRTLSGGQVTPSGHQGGRARLKQPSQTIPCIGRFRFHIRGVVRQRNQHMRLQHDIMKIATDQLSINIDLPTRTTWLIQLGGVLQCRELSPPNVKKVPKCERTFGWRFNVNYTIRGMGMKPVEARWIVWSIASNADIRRRSHLATINVVSHMCMIVVDGLFKSITRYPINSRIFGVNKYCCCCWVSRRTGTWVNVIRISKIAYETKDEQRSNDNTHYRDTLPLDGTLPAFFTPSLLLSTPLVLRCLACQLPTRRLILPRRLFCFLFISRLYLL